MVTVREAWVMQSPLVKNREKTLAEKAAMSAEEQRREIDEKNRILEQAAQERSKLQTQNDEDFENGSGGSSSSSGISKGVFFQLDNPRDIIKRNNDIQAGRYSDRSRSSGREKPNIFHPLDVSLQRELGEKVQITSTREIENRLPNSDSIVPKNVRGERKPYDRYGASANPDYKDPYDG